MKRFEMQRNALPKHRTAARRSMDKRRGHPEFPAYSFIEPTITPWTKYF